MKRQNHYSERLAADDAKNIIEQVFHRQNYMSELRDTLAAVLRQIVAREMEK